jgi:hypothetical protein
MKSDTIEFKYLEKKLIEGLMKFSKKIFPRGKTRGVASFFVTTRKIA